MTFILLDSTLLITRLLVLKKPTQKYGHPSKGVNKKNRNEGIKLKPLMSRAPFVAPNLEIMLKPLI